MTAIQKLKETLLFLQNSTCPEDVFGDIRHCPEEQIKEKHRNLVKIVFVDSYKRAADKKIAEEAMRLLNKWHALAKKKLADNAYGDRSWMAQDITISTKKDVYTITKRLAPGDICEIYAGVNKAGEAVVLKVPRNPGNSDLLLNEAKRIKFLREESPAKNLKILVHVPELVDSFQLQQGKAKKQVNVFKRLNGYYTLAEVLKEYPAGIDIRDAAWMFNRLLGSLWAAYLAGLVHGAVIPSHIMVCPENHNGILIDWCYSVETQGTIKAISSQNKPFYPSEVLSKKPATSKTDIYMLAACLIALLGGDIDKLIIPTQTPLAIKGLIRACLLSAPHRTSDPYELYGEFGAALRALYGPRKWRDFSMPKAA